jgi:MinD-like ATPase involved in chromosome partitioning or flagellar assembly
VLPPTVPGLRRRWRAVRAVMASRRSVSAVRPGDFAVPARIGVAQRYRVALRATDRSINLETMVRSAPFDHCRVIAVVSPKGGPGKTTITALLGTLLAELRRDPVIALDANPDLGDLVHKLGGDDTDGAAVVDDLAAWLGEHPQAPPAQLWSRLGTGPHGLRYISTPRPPAGTAERMIAAADFELYRGLIARLRDYAGIVVVDCGTGLLDPPVQAALEAADQIVLVTDSAATTARQVVAAANLLPEGTPIWLVANKMPGEGARVDLARVVAAIPRLEGLTVVPVPKGGPPAETIVTPAFRWSAAPEGWQQPMRELAARLADEWQTDRTGRP